MNVRDTFEHWLHHVDESDKDVLAELGGDARKLEDAFYRNLAFGTGGLRGKLGLGPNRLNVYTVGKATQGLANYLNSNFDSPSVAIARDSRHRGEAFARICAQVLAANGVRAYLYPRIESTPALSFAVRDLKCSAGVCITASHNPAVYNGYKVYGADGCQITVEAARAIQCQIDSIDPFDDVVAVSFERGISEGFIRFIDEDTIDRYCEAVLKQSTGADCSDLSCVYTPLNGTGAETVTRVLEHIGVGRIDIVEEQACPDGDFPTCPYPNPEVPEALALGIDLCEKTGADLLLATDPDADRVGIAVRHLGAYRLLTGNEVGLLLLDHLARRTQEQDGCLVNKVAMTTIVSAPMADSLAAEYGFELRRTLTGFKFIGEKIGEMEREGRAEDFLFGFEESYGYLAGTYVRDKDAVVASMLICEMAAYWKERGCNLWETMQALYERYGFWGNEQVSVTFDGAEGAARMEDIMLSLRRDKPSEIGGLLVEKTIDYRAGTLMPTVNPGARSAAQELPPADVLEFRLAGGSRVLIRPSGTEPKIKAYVFACASTAQDAETLKQHLCASAEKIFAV